MDSKKIRTEKQSSKHEEEKHGFFQNLFANLFGSTSPEAELKRQLKTIAKDLSKSKYHNYYKASSIEVTPVLAKLFYDIYKIISPAQLLFHANENMNAFKHQIMNYSLSDKQLELLNHLDDQKIQEMAGKVSLENLTNQIDSDLKEFCDEFDDNRINKIENLYKSFVLFRDFCSFDYYVILKKFNSSIQENLFTEVPEFEKINAEYIVDDLKDFCTVAYAITNDTIVWNDLFEFFKSTHSAEIVGLGNWKKIVAKIRSIQLSGAFDLMIRHITKKPNYQVMMSSSIASLSEPYLAKVKADTKKSLESVSSKMKQSKANSISSQIFGNEDVKMLRYYIPGACEQLAKKNLPVFVYSEPLNYLKAFLVNFVKRDVREYYDVVVIRGQWDAQLAQPLSNAYQELLKISDEISRFDNSMAEVGPIGMKIKTLLPKTAHDPGAENIVRRLVGDANEEARGYLITCTQNCITIGKIMKQLIEDYMKQKPVIVGNWRELERYTEKPMKEFSVSIYKKLYLFVQLMQQYLSN